MNITVRDRAIDVLRTYLDDDGEPLVYDDGSGEEAGRFVDALERAGLRIVAAGVCEGNAARDGQELAEVERVLVEKAGERDPDLIGEPLAEQVAAALDRVHDAAAVAAYLAATDGVTPAVLAQAIHDASSTGTGPGGEPSDVTRRLAGKVRERLAETLEWDR